MRRPRLLDNQPELAACGLRAHDQRKALSPSAPSEVHPRASVRLPSSLCKPSLRTHFDWEDSWNEDYAKRPVLLDLFSGAGGAAFGYYLAGFRVVGVDLRPMPRYPFEFYRADALTFPLDGFDAIHASPPCQAYSVASQAMRNAGKEYPDLVAPTRARLQKSGLPWVMENVPGAPIRPDIVLCGCQMGLKLRRERWFETSWQHFSLMEPHQHTEPVVSVVGHGTPTWVRQKLGFNPTIKHYREAMGIDWMNRDELSLAIPPAYTTFIGRQLLKALEERAA